MKCTMRILGSTDGKFKFQKKVQQIVLAHNYRSSEFSGVPDS